MLQKDTYLPATSLTVGEKTRLLRKHRGISQDEMAEIIRARRSRVSRVERGEDEYTDEQMRALRVHFNIEELPLTPRECTIFVRRLYYLRSLIKIRKMIEAEQILKEMANIGNLEPCDFDMVMLCRMFEVQFLIVNKNYADAEKKLGLYDDSLDAISLENLYHYYYNKGYLSICLGDYDNGLKLFLLAYDLMESHEGLLPENDERLYSNIALCYTYIEMPYKAIHFLLMARQIFANDMTLRANMNMERMLAQNYVNTNQLDMAQKLLDKCLIDNESIKGNDTHTGSTLFSTGFICKKKEDWASAAKYFEQAAEYFQDGTDNYYAAIYQKLSSILHTTTFSKAKQLIQEAKSVCVANELWSVYFEALGHYLVIKNRITLYNNESCDYIENIAIPKFIMLHDYFCAVDFYELLAKHYEMSKRTTKSLLAEKEILNIYRRCFANQEGEI